MTQGSPRPSFVTARSMLSTLGSNPDDADSVPSSAAALESPPGDHRPSLVLSLALPSPVGSTGLRFRPFQMTRPPGWRAFLKTAANVGAACRKLGRGVATVSPLAATVAACPCLKRSRNTDTVVGLSPPAGGVRLPLVELLLGSLSVALLVPLPTCWSSWCCSTKLRKSTSEFWPDKVSSPTTARACCIAACLRLVSSSISCRCAC